MGRDERLDAQLDEARALLAEVRGVTKDLRHAVAEARAAFFLVAEERFQPFIDDQMNKLERAMTKAMEEAQVEIASELRGFTNILLTGKPNGQGTVRGQTFPEVMQTLAEARREGEKRLPPR